VVSADGRLYENLREFQQALDAARQAGLHRLEGRTMVRAILG
jgi:hypothetical protein